MSSATDRARLSACPEQLLVIVANNRGGRTGMAKFVHCEDWGSECLSQGPRRNAPVAD